jgi:hypothetical protein
MLSVLVAAMATAARSSVLSSSGSSRMMMASSTTKIVRRISSSSSSHFRLASLLPGSSARAIPAALRAYAADAALVRIGKR